MVCLYVTPTYTMFRQIDERYSIPSLQTTMISSPDLPVYWIESYLYAMARSGSNPNLQRLTLVAHSTQYTISY